jgi:transposase InsO family protein
VCGVVAKIGLVGWRTIHATLAGHWTSYVVQEVVAHLKARRRRRLARVRKDTARHVEVLASGAVWSLDGTHLGRTADHRAVEGQVLKDNGSRSALAVDVARAATGRDVVAQLEQARRHEGTLPLALVTDNGSPYTCDEVSEYLAREQVLHIRNLPHTPQHNGACEQLNGELKADCGLGKGVRIGSLRDAALALEGSRKRLNRRPRAVLGWQTAEQRHRTAARRYTAATRERVYETGRRAMQDAMQRTGTVRARRLAARRAALATLEHYGIIKQTRGSDD